VVAGALAMHAAGHGRLALGAWSLAGLIYVLAAVKGWLRQSVVAWMVPDPALRRGALLVDAFGAPLMALFNLGLMIASGISSRFWWRGTRFEMRSIEDVRVLARAG
jgi:hypothetical protein